MGVFFEPPPSRAKRRWAILELLSRNGYTFQTEGSKAFVESILLISKRTTLEGAQRRLELLREREEENRVEMRLKGYKRQRKDHRRASAV